MLRPTAPRGRLIRLCVSIGLFIAVLSVLLALPHDRVLAHATLMASDPADDAVLPLSPSRVSLTFAEPVDSRLTSIEVTTTDGKLVSRDDLAVQDGGRRAVVSLVPLERGTYIVDWKNVSTIDGHPLSGRYAFHVGARSTDVAVNSNAPLFPSKLEPPARFILDGGLLLLGGTLSVLVSVVRTPKQGATTIRTSGLYSLAFIAAGLALVGAAIQLTAQASATGASPLDLFGGRWGAAYLVRASAVAAAGSLVFLHRPRLALVAAAIALASIPATSHGAAVRGLATPAIIADALHLAAVSIWVGGLPAMLLIVWTQRERRAEVVEALRRFSTLALISTGVAGLTGIYLAWVHVLQLSALESAYGRGVVVKLLLFVVLVILGAITRRWTLPALARGARHRMRFTLAIEVACGLGLLAAVAVMTSTLPARETLKSPLPGGVNTAPDGTRIELRARPGLPGANEITVTVHDSRGRAVEGAAVAVRAAPVGQAADEPLPATSAGNGQYRLSAVLGARGIWAATVSVSPQQGFDSNAAFRLEVGGATPPRPSPSVSHAWTGFGWLLVLGGAFAAAVADREWQWRDRRRSPWYGASVAAVGIIVLLIISPRLAEPTSLPPASSATLALGKQVYEANCQRCHGVNLVPVEGAADLRAHLPVHGEVYLLEVVSNGRPGTAMPAFRDMLTEKQIGAVLTYAREQAMALSAASGATSGAAATATPTATTTSTPSPVPTATR